MGTVPQLVLDVFTSRIVAEIGQVVVRRIPVVVANLQPLGARAYKCGHHEPMNPHGFELATKEKHHAKAFVSTTGTRPGAKNTALPETRTMWAADNSIHAANAAKVADLVRAFKPNYGLPKFTGRILNGLSHCALLKRCGQGCPVFQHRWQPA